MLSVCSVNFNSTTPRVQSFITVLVSASKLLLRTIKFCFVVFDLTLRPLVINTSPANNKQRRLPAIFAYALAFDALVRGLCRNTAITFSVLKLELSGNPTVKNQFMSSRFDRIHERDRHIDGRTDTARRHRPRFCITSRSKKSLPLEG